MVGSFPVHYGFYSSSTASLLDGVANTGIVELDEVEFASFLAERRSTGQPFFRKGSSLKT